MYTISFIYYKDREIVYDESSNQVKQINKKIYVKQIKPQKSNVTNNEEKYL